MDDLTRLPDRDFRDPWGNRVQVVQYSDIQFSKSAGRAGRHGPDHLDKSPAALEELRKNGLR